VELLVDGMRVDDVTDHVTPWSFEIELAPGVHTVIARAVDHADRSTESEPIAIGVDEDPAPDMAGCGCGPFGRSPPDGLWLLVVAIARKRTHR
jgi:hypothetical protein